VHDYIRRILVNRLAKVGTKVVDRGWQFLSIGHERQTILFHPLAQRVSQVTQDFFGWMLNPAID
jgi:hypothetical protein